MRRPVMMITSVPATICTPLPWLRSTYRPARLRWYHQIVPHDIWGYDVASPPVLFDFPANGKTVRAVAEASKSGWLYIFDREDRQATTSLGSIRSPERFALPQADS